jgi:hypothetical protein
MFFQAIAPNVMLLGKFYRKADSPVEAALQNEASRVLEDNLNILASYYERSGKKVRIVDGNDLPSRFDPKVTYIVRIPMPPVSRPLAARMEEQLQAYYKSSHDAGLHEKRLVTAGLFNNGLNRTAELEEDLVRLTTGSGDKHLSDKYNQDLLTVVSKRTSDLVSLATRYAGLSQEYQKDSVRLQQSQMLVQHAVSRLQVEARNADAPLQEAALDDLQNSLTAFLRACDEFSAGIKKNEKNDTVLYQLATAYEKASEMNLAAIQENYPYGTDLYRTFLNLLQVRTSTDMTVVIPHFRNPGVEKDEAEAVEQIRKTFAVLYPNVTVIPAPSDGFIKQLGSVHCITKTLPLGIEVLDNRWNRAEAE